MCFRLWGSVLLCALCGCSPGQITARGVDGGAADEMEQGAEDEPEHVDDEEGQEEPSCSWARVVEIGDEPLIVYEESRLESRAIGRLGAGVVREVLATESGDVIDDPKLGQDDLWYRITTGWIAALYTECADPPTSSEWVWPVPSDAIIDQPFKNPIQYQSCGFHTGIDTMADEGNDIVAAMDGTVVHVGPMWYEESGKGRGPFAIIIEHPGGLSSTYGHNSKALVTVGQQVTAGEPIAEVGTLGYSSAPHLHFEIVEGLFTGDWAVPFTSACGAYRDPIDYVPM